MTAEQRDDRWYGDRQSDIVGELERYSALINHPLDRTGDAVCQCQSKTFQLALDGAEGVALRHCTECAAEHFLGDGAEYADGAELDDCGCPCGSDIFEITAGVSLLPDTDDVRWFYVGCRCTACGALGVYGDWKNEYHGYQALLQNV